jgi:hypothetical protein
MIDFKKLKKHQVIPVIYRIDVLLGNVYAETFKNCEVICCNSTKDLSDFEIKEIVKSFRLLKKDTAVEVFGLFDTTISTEVLNYLSDKEAVLLIEEM